MVRGGGENLARTAWSVVRGLNRGPLSKLPAGVPNITGDDYQEPFLGNFTRTFPEDSETLEERLPGHYMEFYNLWKKGPSVGIHQKLRPGRFEKDKAGRIVPIQNPSIPILYPNEFHQGLWGGQGVVKGHLEPPPPKHKPSYKAPQETYWMPNLFIGVVYSEVLDAHMEVRGKKSTL